MSHSGISGVSSSNRSSSSSWGATELLFASFSVVLDDFISLVVFLFLVELFESVPLSVGIFFLSVDFVYFFSLSALFIFSVELVFLFFVAYFKTLVNGSPVSLYG